MERFGATFYKNGAALGSVLSSDQDLDPEQRKEILEAVESIHAGPDRAHRFLIIGAGMKYPRRRACRHRMRNSWRAGSFQRSEICGPFGVPPHMIGDLERATFSNVENESLRWLRDGLEPHLVNWESALRRDCLGPRSFNTYYARFIRAAMLRGDMASRSQALATQRQNGVISANEWRALEEMDPISKTDGGDTYIVNSAAQPAVRRPTEQQP